jgi:uncharacterized protein YukE
MVSSTNVKSDKKTIHTAVKNTSSAIDGMSGDWEGKSYTNLKQRFSDFKQSVRSFDIDMDNFADALDLYKKYLEKKEEINNEIEKLNNYGDDQAEDKKRSRYRITYKKGELEDIGKQIQEKLSMITGVNYSSKALIDAIKQIDTIDPDGFPKAQNIVDKGEYMGIDGDYEKVIDIFGGQLDNHNNGASSYTYDGGGCDNYARAYAIYLQTGKIPSNSSCGVAADGMTPVCGYGASGGSRKGQAEYAYEYVKKTGRPCVIHVNSGEYGSGQGHWMCVVGYKKGVTKENVTIDDLVVIDSASPVGINGTSASVRYVGDDKYYGDEGLDRCSVDSGYHVYTYEEN